MQKVCPGLFLQELIGHPGNVSGVCLGVSPLVPVSTTLILECVLRSSADIPAFVGQLSQVNTPLP